MRRAATHREPAALQRRARRIRAIWIPELSADPADSARYQHGVSFLNAKPPPAHARRPWVQRGCCLRPKHNYDAANSRRGDGALFSAGLGGTSGHTAQSVHGEMEVLRAGKI